MTPLIMAEAFEAVAYAVNDAVEMFGDSMDESKALQAVSVALDMDGGSDEESAMQEVASQPHGLTLLSAMARYYYESLSR